MIVISAAPVSFCLVQKPQAFAEKMYFRKAVWKYYIEGLGWGHVSRVGEMVLDWLSSLHIAEHGVFHMFSYVDGHRKEEASQQERSMMVWCSSHANLR